MRLHTAGIKQTLIKSVQIECIPNIIWKTVPNARASYRERSVSKCLALCLIRNTCERNKIVIVVVVVIVVRLSVAIYRNIESKKPHRFLIFLKNISLGETFFLVFK